MSYNKNNKSVKKPFCKVCQDAGKSEMEYTSHYVRSLPDARGNTKITCPTLAATECRYCYKLGHTTKFCPAIKENEKRSQKQKSVANYAEKPKPKAAPKKPVNQFDALASESDEDKPEHTPVVKEEYPTLGVKKEAAPITGGWAEIVAKSPTLNPEAPVFKPAPVKQEAKKVVFAMKSWADYSSSEDEDEEEEEEKPVAYSTEYSDDEWNDSNLMKKKMENCLRPPPPRQPSAYQQATENRIAMSYDDW